MNTTAHSISVVINTKNSAKTLEAALQSVKDADEIVVVDMHSHDDTLKIAAAFTTNITSFDDVGYVEPARNAAISKAHSEWILILDADEQVPSALWQKLHDLAAGDATADAYFLARYNIMFGKPAVHAGWWPDFQLRFFRKGSEVWQVTIHSQPVITGTIDYLAAQQELALQHDNYQTISDFVTRLDRYTTHQSGNPATDKNSPNGDEKSSPTTAVINAFHHELLSRLFQHQGISGGIRGIGLSYLQSFYELVTELKHWERVGRPEDSTTPFEIVALLQKQQGEWAYWLANWQVEHTTGITQFCWRIRRKFRF